MVHEKHRPVCFAIAAALLDRLQSLGHAQMLDLLLRIAATHVTRLPGSCLEASKPVLHAYAQEAVEFAFVHVTPVPSGEHICCSARK